LNDFETASSEANRRMNDLKEKCRGVLDDPHSAKKMHFHPSGTLHLFNLNELLSSREASVAFLVGNEFDSIITETIEASTHLCGFPFKSYSLDTFDSTSWLTFLKRLIADAVLHDSKMAVKIVLKRSHRIPESFWFHIHTTYDSGKSQEFWSQNEFEEIASKLLTEHGAGGLVLVPSMADHVNHLFQDKISTNLKFIFCLDRSNTDAPKAIGTFSVLCESIYN
jgi:hypothetical protein